MRRLAKMISFQICENDLQIKHQEINHSGHRSFLTDHSVSLDSFEAFSSFI